MVEVLNNGEDEARFVQKHKIRIFDYPIKNNGLFVDMRELSGQRVADNGAQAFYYENRQYLDPILQESFGKKWRVVKDSHIMTENEKFFVSLLEKTALKKGNLTHKDGSNSNVSPIVAKTINQMLENLDDKNRKVAMEEILDSKESFNGIVNFIQKLGDS